MPDRIFRLLERLQRLDDFLRSAQRRHVPDPMEMARLITLKNRIKQRLASLLRPREGGGLVPANGSSLDARGPRLRGDAAEFGFAG